MDRAEAIRKLKGKDFELDFEVCVAIQAVANLAWEGLLAEEEQAPLGADQFEAKKALQEVFGFKDRRTK